MEPFDRDLALTSSEAADLLGVHASTVKRWSNDGDLGFEKTNGGHRRFHVGELTDFARERDLPNPLSVFHPYEPHVWTALRAARERGSFDGVHSLAMGWIRRGDMVRLAHLYDTLARFPDVDLCTFFDQGVQGLMKRIGEAWQAGRLRVGEEHMTSQVILETLIKLRTERMDVQAQRAWRDAPAAIVGSLEGNQHYVGSQCVRILLESLGWHVYFLGPSVPLEDFASLQRGREAELVCIALTPPATGGDLVRATGTLKRFYDHSRPYALALGGSLPEVVNEELLTGPFTNVGAFDGCRSFRDALQAGFAPTLEGLGS